MNYYLDRFNFLTEVLLDPTVRVSEGYRRRLIIERQQLLTKLVAAGIIDNS